MKMVRVRIAPSPTGQDLHIGNVYTALLNYVFARKNKGKFVVRIEDTDTKRLIPGSRKRILDSLKWLGLDYDEGPDIGGPFGPYIQSERLDLYRHYAEKLVRAGHAYYCLCTPERLENLREEQKAKGMPTMYDGHCRKPGTENPSGQALGSGFELRTKKEKYVIRLNVPEEGITEFTDVIRGKIAFENKLIDDQVLLKSDGYPTYHLGVVVDDYSMKISHVIRAEEWISSTPKHILIYNFLGWDLPVFAHGPVLRNPDKSKLSKRKNPVWLSWYKEQGFLPEAILNYLALMGWSPPEGGKKDTEIFSIGEMMKHFRLEDIKPVGPAFDLAKLIWMNGEYLRKMGIKNLELRIENFVGKKYNSDVVLKTIPFIRERIKKLSDYLPLCGFFFNRPEKYEIDLAGKKEMLSETLVKLAKLDQWKAEFIGKAMKDLVKAGNYKSTDYFMTIRVAVTGKKISPPLNESMEILGKDEVLIRLRH